MHSEIGAEAEQQPNTGTRKAYLVEELIPSWSWTGRCRRSRTKRPSFASTLRTFKDAGVRPSIRRWVREEFRCHDCETRRRTGTRRLATMPRAYYSTWLWASKRKICLACRVKALLFVDGMLGCQAGSHRQDLNGRAPRCGERLERLQ